MGEHEDPGLDNKVAQESPIERLMESREQSEREKPFGLYVVEPPDPAVELAKQVETEVFGEFFESNTPEFMEREYGPFEQYSTFLFVVDQQTKQPAGVMRLIRNSEQGLKSVNDLEKPPWSKPLGEVMAENPMSPDLDHTLDIATFAVLPQYRQKADPSSPVSSALYHATIAYSLEHGYTDWVAILDDKVLNGLIQPFGEPFEHYQGLGSETYLDSPASTPVYLNLQRSMDRVQQFDQGTYDFLIKGVGLESVSLPPYESEQP